MARASAMLLLPANIANGVSKRILRQGFIKKKDDSFRHPSNSVARGGFEPPLPGPKPGVLPLDDRALSLLIVF